MKVLHVNYFDDYGGAAIAGLRIFKAQRKYGIDARMLVVIQNTDIPDISPVSKTTFWRIKLFFKISTLLVNKLNKSTNPVLHSINLFGSGLHRQINKTDCDIVHLHWINREMLSIREISKISKPVVWTLHDSWAFCGAEHHPNGLDDDLYARDYLPKQYKGFNINRWVLKRKKRLWKNKSFRIVTPSSWETESAKKSSLFANNEVITVPNCLDPDIFKPIDKNVAKGILNLRPDKRYILFGAAEVNKMPVKGGDLLKSALEIFIEKYKPQDVELLIFGSSSYDSFSDIDLPVHFLGTIHSEYAMSLVYNSADVMLVPSRMDNLPQTATEPASCGTPVVCFSVGGLVDIVEHKSTGYIAGRFDFEDFAEGINWVLNEADSSLLSKKAREKALANYNEKKCVDSYLNVYNEILKR
ncbi:MAG: glycosyltransferase [Prevotellaceae bacterium]|jgi:glycosyltransferase involved in cell wall biosynthesis|nr:glycosyltransferase [Prevotellaceae bacterium]